MSWYHILENFVLLQKNEFSKKFKTKIRLQKWQPLQNKLSVSEPSPEHQGQDARLNRDLNAQLTEHRTEEHHEEWVGYK